MKRIKFLNLLIASLLLFVFLNLFFNNLRAEERTPAQVNYQVDFWYKETLDFYQQGRYAEAKNKLNKIIKTLASNPPAVIWRSSHKMEPPQETFYKMLKQTEEQIEWKKIEQKQLEQEELERKRKELSRQREERQKQLAEEKAKREEERKAREEALAKQKEERLKQKQELEAKREQQRKAKEEELARQREERLKQEAELKAKQEEERKLREEELARQKEERLKQQAELEAKQQQELKAKQREQARLEAERRARGILLKAQKEREAQEKQKQLAEEKAKREEERKAKQEELSKQRQDKQKQLAEEKARRAEERKAKEEELAKQKVEKEKQQQELKARRAEERKAKEEELAKQKVEKEKQQQELKAKREEELKAKQEALAKQREERLKQQQELKAKQEQEREAKEAELKAQKQKETQEKQLKLEAEHKAKGEELAQQRLKQQAELEAKKQEEQKAKQEELSREREELELKVNQMKKASVQEKAMTEAMLKKHRHDQAKLKKIEKLWISARRLYNQGMYEQAIKDFDELIKLEGNPRIKYTPSALEYIEKAKENLIQKKEITLSKGLEQIEKEMVNEVLKQQIPPYIELPKRIEQKEPTFLIEPPAVRKKLKAIKITMDFDKVGLKSVLAFLAQESGINFVASQKVLELALVVSARFKETSLDEVIKYITKNLGLLYRIDKEIVWVAHPEEIANEPMETRVYYLNRGGGLFTEFSPMSSGTTETGLGGSSAQINKIFTIEDTLKEVVSWPADAKLTYDKRLNALIVRNTPQNLQMLEDILYSMDVEPLQVLIEARFLEVNITDTKELGLEWNIRGGDFTIKDRDGTFKKGIGKDSGVDFSAFTRASEGLNLTYKGMLTNSQFQAVLHALEESKKIKTLSSPRITTLNNQLASIKVVDEWIYPTRYEYEIVQSDNNGDGDFSDAGETTYKNVPKDFLRRDVGILLKVIPAVGADKKTISLSLIPEVSEGTADGFTYTGGVTLPKFTSRNLSTTVVVNSGETVVLGGLIKESRTKTLTKVPVLGNIPLLGAFFRKNTDSIERKNLLIFVTAKVLSASGEEVVVAQK